MELSILPKTHSYDNMKTVDPSKYDSEYFATILHSVDYSKKVTTKSFKPIHHFIADLVTYAPGETIVDYGCGNGDLAFLLALKYGCHVLGIDYSKDAIDIANSNRGLLMKTKSLDASKTEFICADIDHTPRKLQSQVSAVYLADVVEHLYDHELDTLFNIVSKWGGTGMKVIVHTDNNAYLTYVRPLIDLVSVIARSTTIAKISERNRWEKERHVNLTTPMELKRSMHERGYKAITLRYSPLSKEKVQAQIGPLQTIPFLTEILMMVGTLLTFLLPSFYIVFEKIREK